MLGKTRLASCQDGCRRRRGRRALVMQAPRVPGGSGLSPLVSRYVCWPDSPAVVLVGDVCPLLVGGQHRFRTCSYGQAVMCEFSLVVGTGGSRLGVRLIWGSVYYTCEL